MPVAGVHHNEPVTDPHPDAPVPPRGRVARYLPPLDQVPPQPGPPPRLDPDSPVPLFEQVGAEVITRIERGVYRRRLPSITDLAEEFGVARETAHRALRWIAAQGVAVASGNRGYYVSPERYPGNYRR